MTNPNAESGTPANRLNPKSASGIELEIFGTPFSSTNCVAILTGAGRGTSADMLIRVSYEREIPDDASCYSIDDSTMRIVMAQRPDLAYRQ
ncbi:MAG: hypothetical protein IBJ05_08435 [Blastomonas sp.]|nr:hypothetical protein [Blastomonas sp.]